jgi:hypothetical protein
MSSTFAVASLPAPVSVPRRHSLGRLMTTSTSLLLTVIGTLIIVLAFLILFHHNLNATKGYRLRTLEHARSQLLLEQEVLNMQIAKSQSLETLQDDPQVQFMQKPTKAKYAKDDASVARSN